MLAVGEDATRVAQGVLFLPNRKQVEQVPDGASPFAPPTRAQRDLRSVGNHRVRSAEQHRLILIVPSFLNWMVQSAVGPAFLGCPLRVQGSRQGRRIWMWPVRCRAAGGADPGHGF